MMRVTLAFILGVLVALAACWATTPDYRHELVMAERRLTHQKTMLADTHRFWRYRLEHERRHFAPICVDVKTMTAPEMLWHIEDVLRQINLDGRTK